MTRITRSSSAIHIVVRPAPRGMGRSIGAAARTALVAGRRNAGAVEISVVGLAEMRRHHRDWMGDARETDVLTFDFLDGPSLHRVDGQLLVCEPVARREARRRGTDWRGELLLYVVHGCLHLCGYDDHRPADAAKMHKLEDRILTRLGWGSVFTGGRGR